MMKHRPFLLLFLGFLAACVFDVACPRHDAEAAQVSR